MRETTLREQAERIAARKREIGFDETRFERARNGGRHRTLAKRLLLQAIDEAAARDGIEPPFPARYVPVTPDELARLDLDRPDEAGA